MGKMRVFAGVVLRTHSFRPAGAVLMEYARMAQQAGLSLDQRVARVVAQARQVRKHIVEMVFLAQSGHIGGSLSATDIVTALYWDLMRIDPAKPRWPGRDRFILSKGHACPVWYANLALRGYFGVEHLKTLRKFGSILQGHPDMNKTPGVDITTGSLGQGLSLGVGMALNARLSGLDYRTYVVLGDGEINEGQVWEAAASAAKYKLDNLIAFVDNNRLQMDGFGADIMPMEPIDAKFRAFNWEVARIDGHDVGAILTTVQRAWTVRGRPFCIVADTVKGKGVSFMENQRAWHGEVPTPQQYEVAMAELEGA
jgi:transketolase